MLNQIDIYIKAQDIKGLHSDLSVKIHGFIMSKIQDEKAKEYHKKALRPFSIYTVDMGEYYICRISCLNDEAFHILDVFKNEESIRVFGKQNSLKILDVVKTEPLSLTDLAGKLNFNHCRLTFITPASYRSGGFNHHDPCLYQYFNSVIYKLKAFENIDITKEQLIEAFYQIKIKDYSLTTQIFLSGGRKIYGMVGSVEITLPTKGDYSRLIPLILAYSTYSGVGGGTSQGMGGVFVEKL